jgi:hypothetical chaperone protein
MNYLAVDFGTTNSLAGVIDEHGSLKLVKLDGDNYEMPSSIFLKVVHEPPLKINHEYLETKAKKFCLDDQIRFENDHLAVDKKLKEFIQTNKPKLIKPKPTYSFSGAFQKKWEQFERDLKDYPKIFKIFLETDVVRKKSELLNQIRSPISLDEARNKIRLSMEQDLIDAEVEELGGQTFFSALNSEETVAFFGSTAISEYLAAPLSGFFMGSPKAFLAVQLSDSQKELFTRVMTLVLTEIKNRSEKYLEIKCDGVVFGRPVNYMGSEQGGSNEQALAIMRKAAISAGFNEVRFVIEPMAAALAISNTIFESNLPVLLIDIGGGTTDVVMLDVDSAADETLTVIGSSGERIGGCDFDQSIAISKIGPFIGMNSLLKSGAYAPNGIVIDGLSTRDIYKQAKFRKSGQQINTLINTSAEPIFFQRLLQIMQQQLQHRLLLNSEELKKSLTSIETLNIEFDYLMYPLKISITQNDFRNICKVEVNQILKIVNEVLTLRNSTTNRYRVFITGGMSISTGVVDAIQEVISPGISIRRIPALRSVIAGLTKVARQLSLSQSSHTEPISFRGIPIGR